MITESVKEHTVFPVHIDGEAYTEGQLKRKRVLACQSTLMSVSDDLVDLVAEHTDPTMAWKTLKEIFHSSNQSQILTLMGQLQSLRMNEGSVVEDYVKKACEIKN